MDERTRWEIVESKDALNCATGYTYNNKERSLGGISQPVIY